MTDITRSATASEDKFRFFPSLVEIEYPPVALQESHVMFLSCRSLLDCLGVQNEDDKVRLLVKSKETQPLPLLRIMGGSQWWQNEYSLPLICSLEWSLV